VTKGQPNYRHVLKDLEEQIEDAENPKRRRVLSDAYDEIEKVVVDLESNRARRRLSQEELEELMPPDIRELVRRQGARKNSAHTHFRRFIVLASLLATISFLAWGATKDVPEVIFVSGILMVIMFWRHRSSGGFGNAIAFLGIFVSLFGLIGSIWKYLLP
jgi:hypothetical protein